MARGTVDPPRDGKPGRRPSMRDVARAAGVSASLVSLVASGRPGVKPETRELTLATMRQLGYVPKHRASHMTGRFTFAILSERLADPMEHDIFYGELLQGIQSVLQAGGHRVVLHLLSQSDIDGDAVLRDVGDDVDGILLVNGGDLTNETIIRIVETQVPAVLVDNYVVGYPLHCVVADYATAGYLVTRHLLDLGHTRIGLLAGPRKYQSLVDRQEGYLDALTQQGIPIDPTLIAPPMPHPGQPKGYYQMQRLLDLPEPPTAVFAISDKTAFGAMQALRERGLQVPRDMAIVGIDDVAEAAVSDPPLTTMHVPRSTMGEEAARRLLALARGEATLPTKITLYTRLVVRESCGAALRAPASLHDATAETAP